MTIKHYDWRNTILEAALGAVPMTLLLWLSNAPSEFVQNARSYILSNEIQLLFVYYLVFGLILTGLSLWFYLSKTLLQLSLELISSFISIGQVFAGILMFTVIAVGLSKAYGHATLLAGSYYVFHLATINLANYLAFMKQKHRHLLAND